jgi:SlyX protein
MKRTEPSNNMATLDDFNNRIQILEEKFEYQERTIDALNDVIIEQQSQVNLLEDQVSRLQALFNAIEDGPGNGEDPPPPHY